MNYELNDNEKKLQLEAAAFAAQEIAPFAAMLDDSPKDAAFKKVVDNLKKLAKANLLSAGIGDGSIDLVTHYVAGEALAKACAATFLSARASAFMCGGLISLFGTAAQKQKYLKPLLSAEKVGAVAYTEPEAGSDIASIAAVAQKDGAAWKLSGVKDIVANAPIADVILVLAWTDKDAGPHKGMSFFIVEKGAKGLTVGIPLETLGMRGLPLAAITLEGCEAKEILGGEPGAGLSQHNKILSLGTIGITALCVGIGASCMEKATLHAKTRKSSGRKIGSFQEVGFKLADMFTMNDLSKMLGLRAAWGMNRNENEAEILGACAKLFASESATKIANMTMQIFAGHGYMKGSDAERLYRDAKFGEICEGPSEIQRTIIAKQELDRYAPKK
ncbi:MAG: acyl-CoA dehydrogenase family protein [Deltaproteobacteria bacterium]|nr:acyl-CoA dehydrogenase family protein [Deltaproteobacteria bacterium]